MVDRLVAGDREEPAAQISRLGLGIGPERGQEGLLKAILRVVGPDHPAQEPEHRRAMLVDQAVKWG